MSSAILVPVSWATMRKSSAGHGRYHSDGGTAASALSTYTDLLDAFTVPFLLDTYEKEREAMVSEEAQAIFDAVEEELGLKIFVGL